MKKTVLMCMVALNLALTGCQAEGFGPKQTVGTGLGALGGGLAGSAVGGGTGRLWATGAGVLLGSLVGSNLGQSIDRTDKMAMQNAQMRAYEAPVGQRISWNNPNTGHRGTYVATRDGTNQSGLYCREYQQTVVVAGKKQSGYGTACQQPDGSWEIIQ